jgi:predicted enzyme related to lactoylglutathione lyase
MQHQHSKEQFMTISIVNVAFDADHAADLAAFWSKVLQHPVDAGANEYFASIGWDEAARLHPSLLFLKVPEGRAGKNRVHLDLAAPDYSAEVERLAAAGAKVLGENSEMDITWTTFADPEGNLFDVAAEK